MRRIWRGLSLAAIGALAAGCVAQTKSEAALPSLYWPMTTADAHVDADAAREMISAYRKARGLGPLALDPDLQRLAETEAAAMAAAERPSQAEIVKAVALRSGFSAPEANISAGYHTLAEAFSGWRDSPPHNATLLDPTARRMGIATGYAPNSKYKVYWALVVAR
jgi:uncharacterized protein YkwD